MVISDAQRITCTSRNYGQERRSGNSRQGSARDDVRRIRQGPGATKWTRIEDKELGEERAGRRGNGDNESSREARRAFIPRTATNISSHRAGNVGKIVVENHL